MGWCSTRVVGGDGAVQHTEEDSCCFYSYRGPLAAEAGTPDRSEGAIEPRPLPLHAADEAQPGEPNDAAWTGHIFSGATSRAIDYISADRHTSSSRKSSATRSLPYPSDHTAICNIFDFAIPADVPARDRRRHVLDGGLATPSGTTASWAPTPATWACGRSRTCSTACSRTPRDAPCRRRSSAPREPIRQRMGSARAFAARCDRQTSALPHARRCGVAGTTSPSNRMHRVRRPSYAIFEGEGKVAT